MTVNADVMRSATALLSAREVLDVTFFIVSSDGDAGPLVGVDGALAKVALVVVVVLVDHELNKSSLLVCIDVVLDGLRCVGRGHGWLLMSAAGKCF